MLVAQAALDFCASAGKFPSWPVLRQLAADSSKRLGEGEEQAIDAYVVKLSELDTRDVDYVAKRVVEFAKGRAIISAIRASVDAIKENKEPDGGFVKLFEDALQVGSNVADMGYILHTDADAIIDKVTRTDYGVMTGFPQFDKIWKRGWGPGWLVVVLAPPKRYKSAFCINAAMNIVGPAIAENVFYYPCEISQELAAARALSNLSGASSSVMYDTPEKFKQLVREQMNIQVAAHLVIKGFPQKSATMNDIRAHAKSVIAHTGIRPKLIIVDYAETIKSMAPKNDPPEQQSASIYTDARILGTEFGCPVLMPDRCNRETVSMQVPSMKSFQGSFQKAGIIDASIGLCSTDQEYKDNVIRSFVFLNRHGRAYQHFRGEVDPETWQMDIGEEIEWNPDAEENEYRRRGAKPGAVPDELV